MIYILESDRPTQANWYKDFTENLYNGLITQTPDVMVGKKWDDVLNLASDDYLFVVHYEDLENKNIRDVSARKIFHHHGSGVSPYTHWIDKSKERFYIKNEIDINTFCMPTQERLVKDYYSNYIDCRFGKSVTIGFPVDLDKFKKYNLPKKKKIVVAGHIGPERQFYLATYLLKDFLAANYEVVFSIVEKEQCVTGKWSTFYDLKRFQEMGFKFHFNPTSESYYNELADASHVFTCSLGDTFSVSILEGYLCGCVPIVPDIRHDWPMYRDYIDRGYDPFSKESVESKIHNYGSVLQAPKVNLDWFKPELVAKRLLEVL